MKAVIKVDPDAIYTRQGLAELFGVSMRTVDRYYINGLPHRKIRGRNMSDGQQVLNWLKQDAEQAPDNPKLIKFRKQNMAR